MADERPGQALTRADLEDDEDLSLGRAYLRALAEISEDMTEIAPGVWHAEKRGGERGFWI